jgi:hypothetical protein
MIDTLLPADVEQRLWFVVWANKNGFRHFTEAFCSDDFEDDGTVSVDALLRRQAERLARAAK